MRMSDLVNHVISLADSANVARAAESADPDSPFVSFSGTTVTRRPPTKEEKLLGDFLRNQSSQVIFVLTALTYLGRGDFDTQDEFLESYAELQDVFQDDPAAAAKQLIDKTLLAKHLELGLKKLASMGVDVDPLP